MMRRTALLSGLRTDWQVVLGCDQPACGRDSGVRLWLWCLMLTQLDSDPGFPFLLLLNTTHYLCFYIHRYSYYPALRGSCTLPRATTK
eukprot:6814294-Prymnesium_polylepis.1